MEEFDGRRRGMLIESYIYAKGEKKRGGEWGVIWRNLRGGGGEWS